MDLHTLREAVDGDIREDSEALGEKYVPGSPEQILALGRLSANVILANKLHALREPQPDDEAREKIASLSKMHGKAMGEAEMMRRDHDRLQASSKALAEGLEAFKRKCQELEEANANLEQMLSNEKRGLRECQKQRDGEHSRAEKAVARIVELEAQLQAIINGGRTEGQ